MNESMGNMMDKWIRIKEDKRGRFSFSSLQGNNDHPFISDLG
jgi:hypothetical protein